MIYENRSKKSKSKTRMEIVITNNYINKRNTAFTIRVRFAYDTDRLNLKRNNAVIKTY